MSIPIFVLYIAILTTVVTLLTAVGCWVIDLRKGRCIYD